ncbi:MAG: hypothetical protein ACI4EN_07965 [Butyrivibrio sp.]
MVKMKKSLFLMVVSFCAALLVVLTPDKASAEDMSSEFQAILNSEGQFVVTGSTMEEYSEDILIYEELQKYGTDEYWFSSSLVDDNTYSIYLIYNEGEGEPETHDVEVVFEESYSDEFAAILNSDNKFQVPSNTKDGVITLINDTLYRKDSEDYRFCVATDVDWVPLINDDFTKTTIIMEQYNGSDWVKVERHIVDLVYLTEPSDVFESILLNNGKFQVPSSTKSGVGNILTNYLNTLSDASEDYRFQIAYDDEFNYLIDADGTRAVIQMRDESGILLEQQSVELSYLTEKSNAYKSILNNDGKLVINAVKPNGEYDFALLFEMVVCGADPNKGYAWDNLADDYSAVDLTINFGTANQETHRVNIVYNYDEAIQQKLKSFVDNFPKEIEFFHVRDLELINYWINNVSSEGSDNLDLYSGELKAAVNNNNIEYFVDNRAGSDELFATIRIGMAIFGYNGCVYYFDPTLGTAAEYIIYVPDTTGNSKEELIAAAQKRINEYLGNTTTVKVSYAGTAYDVWTKREYELTKRMWEQMDPNLTYEEFMETFLPEYDSFDYVTGVTGVTETDDTFLITVKVGGKERSFNVLIRKDSSKMVTPSYKTTDMSTNIEISSDSTSLPLDTYIQASKITSGAEYEKILKLLGIDKNAMFDLKLFSGSLDKYVTTLSDGKFEVRIPIPENFKGKTLTVYYVDQNGKPVEYEVTIKDNYAVFTTDHFSIYTLAEKENGPDVGDVSTPWLWVALLLISGSCLAGTIIYTRKRKEI